jgi:flagellar hook-associated protein 1 FlgK
VKIVAGGALGAATYKVSSDGGTTWGAVQTIPVGGTITAGDGIDLTFPPGTFATNDDFSVKAGCFAKDMQVNSTIVNDSGKIAASATVNNGDGDNANSINAIKDSLLMGGGISSIDNFYQSLVARVGNDVADANRNLDYQTAVMNQLESQKEAVSGVSIDEEMLNLIKYQAGYNAAARMCGVVNEMMDILINLGRE